MLRVESTPDRLEYRRPLGVIRLFGLPFFVTGLGVFISIALGRLRTASGAPDGISGLAGPIVVAFACAAAGAAFLFYGRGISLDRASRTVSSWRGVVVPLYLKRRRLDEFDRVEVTQVRSDDATWYFVELAGERRERFEVAALEDRVEAIRIAEEISRFAGLRGNIEGVETVQP